jgi:fatty-acyl-CoA synthase
MNRGEEEPRSYCKTGLAHFKVPRYIWIVDEFPKTGSGKLHKPRMREMTMDRL